MKLFTKYNRVNIVATIVVLLMSAVVYYFFINKALIHQLDKNLVVEEEEISDYINEKNQLPEASSTKDEQEIYLPAKEIVKRNFSTIILDVEKHKKVYYRQLEFPVSVNNQKYTAVVRKSQEETEDLIELILKLTFAIVILLLASLYAINRLVLNRLWMPFNTALQKMKVFNVSSDKPIQFNKTSITEFSELNEAVSMMTKKAMADYKEIKNFTENASHEIQTPLAIISSKLELLSQSDKLDEEHMNALQVISDTANRLSKLNQSLLLLTKIDNDQFRQSNELNISRLILKHLNNYEELLQAKNIKLTQDITPNLFLIINETLAEIMVSNILTNAIKHNIEFGNIDIILNEKHFSVSNTGLAINSSPDTFFQRFKKESSLNDSLGLGLSIVKKICDMYNFSISYSYENRVHTITIFF